MARDPGNDISVAIINDNEGRMLCMTREQRAKGLLICGVPGSGKTKLMEHMFRQDIRLWHTHHCGALLLDSQGAMYDDVMEYLAACRLDRVPVVPIDLRRNDYVVSYDLLRRRMGGDPAVHIQAAIDAMLHAWGQSGTEQTPLLAKWLEGILFPLYEKERPLVDALQLISDPGVRMQLTRDLENVVAQATWKSSRSLREDKFQEVVDSTANRLRKFLSTQLMRSMLSQKGESLDMSKAITDGAIVIVSLSTAKSWIKPEDAKTFGNLLLSDTWLAAQTRGAPRGVKPFYVYVDECQSYVNPSMVETLDQARKFGLHFTFGMQFPSQFARHGEVGRMIFDSLMANCRSKIVFQQEHPQDAEMLALWLARQAIDPDQIKDEIYSPKVIGHEIRYFPSYSVGVTDSVGGGNQYSVTEGQNYSVGTNWEHADSRSLTLTDAIGLSEGHSVAHTSNIGLTHALSQTNSRHEDFSEGNSRAHGLTMGTSMSTALTRTTTEGNNWSAAVNRSATTSVQGSRNRTVSHAFRRSGKEFRRELDGYVSGEMDEADREEFKRQDTRPVGMTEGESTGASRSQGVGASLTTGGNRATSDARMTSNGFSLARQQTDTLSHGRTQGNAFAQGISDAFAKSYSLAHTHNRGRTRSHSLAQTVGSSDSYGGSESRGVSLAETYGQNDSWSKAKNRGITLSPVVWPVLRWDVTSRTYRSVDEQVFLWTQYIAGQPDRHCLARLAGMRLPVPLITETVKRVRMPDSWIQRWVTRKISKLAFALPSDENRRRAEDQNLALAAVTSGPMTSLEPISARRRLPQKD